MQILKGKRLMSSIASKIVMAVTGLLIALFLVGHLAGNLLLFVGPKAFNAYSYYLSVVPLLVPVVDLWFLALILAHTAWAIKVTVENRRARPVEYQTKVWARGKSRKSLSSTTMMVTGSITLIFIAFHVWHFKYSHPVGAATASTTLVAATPNASAEESRNLASLVAGEFHKPLVVVLYVLAMVIMGLHLYHALSSSFQSLGVENPRWTRAILVGGKIFTVVITGGFAILPLWFYFRGG